ncbi:prolyl oligopeptidase family serine peptidase [Arcanobacterium phocae]|uniref:prolyl oligopeptidase family serine peptidase n=2 Tax=Arcanobacterium phocae TaxID=131112 RepID=UPI001C1234E9|nr:prolyl oligopeptidase family serine peptidase [Arcanobacterium phocae]
MHTRFPSLMEYIDLQQHNENAQRATLETFSDPASRFKGKMSQINGCAHIQGTQKCYLTSAISNENSIYIGHYDAACAIVFSSKGSAKALVTGIDLPAGNRIDVLSYTAKNILFRTSSFIDPGKIWRVDYPSGKVKLLGSLSTLVPNQGLHYRRLSSYSVDGTKIPIDCYGSFDQPRPTIIHIYGGFGINNDPFFSFPIYALWLAQGGNIVLVRSRGGREFGPAWHTAGQRSGRSLVRKDVENSVRTLIQENICNADTTFLHGMSHGALLTAITALHAPDLVKNIICQVPITNTKSLLKNKFGSSWITEYGNPESADWDRFMASEDPIFFYPRHSLPSDSTCYISGYVNDQITPIVHSDQLAQKMAEMGSQVTYKRYNVPGDHHGAKDKDTRIKHTYELWAYLEKTTSHRFHNNI